MREIRAEKVIHVPGVRPSVRTGVEARDRPQVTPGTTFDAVFFAVPPCLTGPELTAT